jgi:protein-L-isoaspartate O-methyltransferase
MVVPVGGSGGQQLVAYTAGSDGDFTRHELDMVSFVPFLGGRE